MAEYKMRGGSVMTEKDFERLSKQASRGDYPGVPGEWIVRPQGRPRLDEGELVTVTCKVTKAQRDAMDERAAAVGETRSEWMRSAFTAALAG